MISRMRSWHSSSCVREGYRELYLLEQGARTRRPFCFSHDVPCWPTGPVSFSATMPLAVRSFTGGTDHLFQHVSMCRVENDAQRGKAQQWEIVRPDPLLSVPARESRVPQGSRHGRELFRKLYDQSNGDGGGNALATRRVFVPGARSPLPAEFAVVARHQMPDNPFEMLVAAGGFEPPTKGL